MTTTQADNLANVPHPAGAVRVCEWDDVRFGIEYARRYFVGTKRVIDRDGLDRDISVEIYGTQGTAGDVTRRVIVFDDDREALDLAPATKPDSSAAHCSPQQTSGARWPTTTGSRSPDEHHSPRSGSARGRRPGRRVGSQMSDTGHIRIHRIKCAARASSGGWRAHRRLVDVRHRLGG